MGEYNIARGKKWAEVRAKRIFEKRDKDVEWMDLQASIVEDIKEYEDSIKKPETAAERKAREKAEAKAAKES